MRIIKSFVIGFLAAFLIAAILRLFGLDLNTLWGNVMLICCLVGGWFLSPHVPTPKFFKE